MGEMQLDFYTKSEVDDKFGGMVIEKISQADFDALTVKDPSKIYYVYDDNGKVTQYVGDAKLGGGTVSADFVTVYENGLNGTVGNLTEV